MPAMVEKLKQDNEQQAQTYSALGVEITPADVERLERRLAGITEAERRAERESATLRVY